MNNATQTTGWKVTKASISERNGGLYVEGVNGDDNGSRFFWHVNAKSLRDARFDFSSCEFAMNALCHYAKMIES